MGYLIKCSSCQQDTWALNIVDLIKDELFQLIEKLVNYECFSKQDMQNFVEKL